MGILEDACDLQSRGHELQHVTVVPWGPALVCYGVVYLKRIVQHRDQLLDSPTVQHARRHEALGGKPL